MRTHCLPLSYLHVFTNQAELKSPLIYREPRAMNSLGNKRTTKEKSSDLKFQNSTLPKNRSWPHLHRTTAQDQAICEPLPRWERKFAAAPDVTEYHSEDEYEDPELQMVDVWPSLKILPARPIKESEYAEQFCRRSREGNIELPLEDLAPRQSPERSAVTLTMRPFLSPGSMAEDTRCFKRVMDTSPPIHAKASLPSLGPSWNMWTRLEEVDKAVSKDMRRHHTRENKSIKGNKTPLPPPRPPATLPKQHQPLPPAPAPENSAPLPQRHTSPEAQGGLRQISLKDLSGVLEAEEVSHDKMRPASSQPSQSRNTRKIPLALTSSSFVRSHNNLQDRGDEDSMQACSAQRCQSPASHGPPGNTLPHPDTSWREPFPAPSDEKEVRHNEWYVGQYSRQAVEEALMKENKDGTFLVRDHSTKSKAEPYVLVVFYGNKVYNVKIRFLEKSQQFALGTGLRGDEKFDSVEDIIEYYQYFPITLIDGKDKTGAHREQCYLTQPLTLAGHFPPG
ncbi:cytokine-dependent hematopoietic cell linker isoform X1 [Marmota monax]|uniref:cytokine-dependent hematopoietic cell linker isoform X1 n=2 Tax=Marmota monax TaxID=9995 RepID=UPI001EB07A00|nr:cytokine-dependent hematopoietic cell linker isoform X1 [Marmota monax]